MRSARILVLTLGGLLVLNAGAAEPAKTDSGKDDHKVRVLYLVPSDQKENPQYTSAITGAVKNLQQWYAKQLGGTTFQLSDPIVEVVPSEHDAHWFAENPNGKNHDDWQYNNTLQDAKKLRGARHNDPHVIWVLYVDSPGHTGRGGSGVTCLPGDDLLGLVGEHPTQKDKNRWIAGLGHEMGHAFGLPHPSDPVKDADAIMWTGIYGKYPDKAYLTAEDKTTLLKSPFFHTPDGKPVVQETAPATK